MPLRPIKRGAVFYAFGTVARQRIRQSLGTSDKARAEELAAQLEARLWKRHSYGEEAVRSFDEAALSYQLAGGERRFLPAIIRRFRGRALGSIKPGEIRALAQSIYPGASPATWNRQVIVPARAVINHGAGLGWCHTITVDTFPTKRPKRIAVDRTWIDAFMEEADRRCLPHIAAAMLFMFQTGTRIGETVRLMPHDLDLHRRIAMLERTKETEWEARHLTTELVVRIANLPAPRRSLDTAGAALPLFGYASRFTLRQAIKRICAAAGIPYVPPHQAGRHSFASNALASGFSVRDVMDAAGWKTARMLLEIYAHTEAPGRAIADSFDANLAHLVVPGAAKSLKKSGDS